MQPNRTEPWLTTAACSSRTEQSTPNQTETKTQSSASRRREEKRKKTCEPMCLTFKAGLIHSLLVLFHFFLDRIT